MESYLVNKRFRVKAQRKVVLRVRMVAIMDRTLETSSHPSPTFYRPKHLDIILTPSLSYKLVIQVPKTSNSKVHLAQRKAKINQAY